MKRVQVTAQNQRFIVVQRDNGLYDVSTQDWFETNLTFSELGSWIWNMADNHDISHIVCETLCNKFGKIFALED